MTLNPTLPLDIFGIHIQRALAEDIGSGDATTQSIIPAEVWVSRGRAHRQAGWESPPVDMPGHLYHDSGPAGRIPYLKYRKAARWENRQGLALVLRPDPQPADC